MSIRSINILVLRWGSMFSFFQKQLICIDWAPGKMYPRLCVRLVSIRLEAFIWKMLYLAITCNEKTWYSYVIQSVTNHEECKKGQRETMWAWLVIHTKPILPQKCQSTESCGKLFKKLIYAPKCTLPWGWGRAREIAFL